MVRRLTTQGAAYVLVGLTQLLLDWAIFSALFAATGVALASNLTGRASAAGLGFWLNGRYTFARDGQARLGAARLTRYATAWLVITAVSSIAVLLTEWRFGAPALYWAKPLIEAGLAVGSFLIAKLWVYD
jgi:putative flippase GtrA